MKKFWRSRFNHEYVSFFQPIHPLQPEELHDLALRNTQFPFQFVMNREGAERPVADISYSFCGGMLFGARAYDVLCEKISTFCNIQQNVKVDGKGGFRLVVAKEVYDCFDRVNTIGRYHESGIWLEVTKLSLKSNSIGPANVFRVNEVGIQWSYILDETIVDLIKSSELTGLILDEVALS